MFPMRGAWAPPIKHRLETQTTCRYICNCMRAALIFVWGPGEPPTPTMPHPTNFRISMRESLRLEGSHHDIQCSHIFIYADRDVCLNISISIHASCKPPIPEVISTPVGRWVSTHVHHSAPCWFIFSIRCLQNHNTKTNTTHNFSNIPKKVTQYT